MRTRPSSGETLRAVVLFIKLFDNPIQCLHLYHRALVSLLVIGVECVFTPGDEHSPVAGAEPREVKLREHTDDATEHLGAYVAFAGVHVVGDVFRRETTLPLEVVLRFAQSLRLRPLHEGS